jgi:hypothetical protein
MIKNVMVYLYTTLTCYLFFFCLFHFCTYILCGLILIVNYADRATTCQ